MKTPALVLLICVLVSCSVILLVFYRYDLLPNSNHQDSTSALPTNTVSVSQESVANTVDVSLANGKKLYEEKTCILCHSATGEADTPTGIAMKSTNLASGAFRNNKANLDPKVYILKVIEDGVPGTAMVGFKDKIPLEKDRKDLAEFVHSLAK